MQFFKTIFIVILSTILFLNKSIAQERPTQKKPKKTSFYFAFDVRWSIVRELPVRISGLKTGISFNRKHAIGFGYYNLGRPLFGQHFVSSPVEYDAKQTLYSRRENGNINVDTKVRLSMDYLSLFYEFRFLARKKWNLDWNTQLGAGNVEIVILNKKNEKVIGGYPKMRMISLVETSVSVQYKIVDWFGLGAGLGYRYMINPNEYISATFNYPIWSLKVMLFPGKLIPVLKGQKKWYK